MQTMHAKLNDMNDVGEQIGAQLSNSPALTNAINLKMDTLETKWNALLEQMEYLSKVIYLFKITNVIKGDDSPRIF